MMKQEKSKKVKGVVKSVVVQNLVPVQAEISAPKELGDEIRPKKLSHNARKFLLGLNYGWKKEKK